jgi:hypothetical protein
MIVVRFRVSHLGAQRLRRPVRRWLRAARAAAVPSLGAEAYVVQAANVASRKITAVAVQNLTHQYDILIRPVMPRRAHERERGRSPTLQSQQRSVTPSWSQNAWSRIPIGPSGRTSPTLTGDDHEGSCAADTSQPYSSVHP